MQPHGKYLPMSVLRKVALMACSDSYMHGAFVIGGKMQGNASATSTLFEAQSAERQ